MRKLIMLILAVTLIASGAFAAKLPAKQAPRSVYSVDFGLTLAEGFETTFPPPGWGAGVTDASYTWYQDSETFYEGAKSARIRYQEISPSSQDETLSFDHSVVAGDDLWFWTMGSVYWAAFANFTVEIDGLVVYDFAAEGTDNFVWEEVVIDLDAYAGSLINVTFRYAGGNGADHHLDAVNIGTYVPPPPPPPIDFCATATVLSEAAGPLVGTTCGGQNLISTLGCEDYPEAGMEDYFGYELCAGGTFTATVTSAADGALWIVGSCFDEVADMVCLAYADNSVEGEVETLSYTNTGTTPMMVYLVVDSWGTDTCGQYTGNYNVDNCLVANEDMGFGQLKAQFR